MRDAADLSDLALANGDLEEHGALCAEVVCAEEPRAIPDEPLPLEVLSESHLAPVGGEACDDACGHEGVGLAVDAGVLEGEADAWVECRENGLDFAVGGRALIGLLAPLQGVSRAALRGALLA
jgi:hypothetical protein